MNIAIAQTIRKLLLPTLKFNECLKFADASNERMDIIRIICHRDDMKQLIGAKGQNLQALKALAAECGRAHDRLVTLVVAEPPVNPAAYNPQVPWSLAICEDAANSLFETLKLPARCSIVEAHDNVSNVLLTAVLPEDVAGPLERWLCAMGRGLTRLVLDDEAVTAP